MTDVLLNHTHSGLIPPHQRLDNSSSTFRSHNTRAGHDFNFEYFSASTSDHSPVAGRLLLNLLSTPSTPRPRTHEAKMMSMNTCSVNPTPVVPRSLNEAIDFLSRPLVMFYTPSEISVVRTVLQTTLTATYFASREPRLFLFLSPAIQPPRPLLAACIASGVRWADWIMALGGKELEVRVEPSRAAIRFGGPGGAMTTVWQESKAYRPAQMCVQRPSAEGLKPSCPTLRAAFNSAIARPQRRTKAQELLEFNDKEEADEIFALLSNVTNITPTPARLQFNGLSPISSPDSSRPSSRSSNLSRFSFDSSSSSAESLTSISTAASDASRRIPVKSVICLPSDFQPPEEIPDLECLEDTPVYVDKSKNGTQKYLYQGGVSTVLSGGVMLGATNKEMKPHNGRPTSGRPQAPIGTRRSMAVGNDWRRF